MTFLLSNSFFADIPESFPNVTNGVGLLGSSLNLECPLNGSGAAISWHTTDGMEIEGSSGNFWTIQAVDSSHAGLYYCMSTNHRLEKAQSRFATARAEFVIHVFNSKFNIR